MGKFHDGFLFGLGFTLALMFVLGLVSAVVAVLVVVKGVDLVATAFEEGGDMLEPEELFVVQSNVVQKSGVFVVTATLTNSGSLNYSNVTLSAEAMGGGAGMWRIKEIENLPAREATNITIAFEPYEGVEVPDDVGFTFDVMVPEVPEALPFAEVPPPPPLK